MSSTGEIELILVPFRVAAELAAAVSQYARELDVVLLDQQQHTAIEQIGRRDGRLAVVELGKARIICDGQPLVTTGCGYLPIGALPTGYLPIGALPTGGAGGGGSLRGRSAAAAALSMAKDAAVASTMLFIMTYSPCVWTASPFGSPKTGQPKRDAPLFPSPLSQGGFHRCTINDALTALATQPKSACITGAIDPFQKSVARIARTLPREAVRIAVLETSPASRRSARRFRWRFTRARSPSRFSFYSKHLESAAPSSAR